MWPTLIAMCGLPFSGKSVLARSLSHELGIRLLSYDFEIYLPHRHLVPPGSPVAAEHDFIQDIARRQIGAFLAAGESLVYDDLLLARGDRRKLAAVARQHRADLVLVYLDTPPSVIDQRQTENARTRTRHSVPEGEMRLDASLLEPPDTAEQAISVRPGDDLTDVLTRIRARLRPEGHASLLPDRGWFVTTASRCHASHRAHGREHSEGNMTRVRHTSLAVLITAMVMAVVTAGTAFALPSHCPPRHALNLHHVNWEDVAIPGALCRVKGVIRLQKGQAKVGHSGYGPLEVSTSGPSYGDLGDGQQVAALQVWCSNQGGTAAGQLVQGIVVFSGARGTLHPLGTLTPQYHPRSATHIPYLAVTSIGAERIVTTEYWYASTDADCCPSGRASTTWHWTGHTFTPTPTTIRR